MRRFAFAGVLGLLILTTGSTFAATTNNVWRAALTTATTTTTTTTTVHGGATIAEVGNGRLASVAVKLYGVKPDSTVQVTVTDTPTTTTSTTPPIWTSPTFKMAATGVNRFWLKGSDVKPLDTAIDNKDTLTITVTVTPKATTGSAPLATVTLTGTFARVR
jgi:hypothetical protein